MAGPQGRAAEFDVKLLFASEPGHHHSRWTSDSLGGHARPYRRAAKLDVHHAEPAGRHDVVHLDMDCSKAPTERGRQLALHFHGLNVDQRIALEYLLSGLQGNSHKRVWQAIEPFKPLSLKICTAMQGYLQKFFV